jgi:hypothetical protein
VKATPSLIVSDPGGTFNGSPFPARRMRCTQVLVN